MIDKMRHTKPLRRIAVLVSGNGSNLQAIIDSWSFHKGSEHALLESNSMNQDTCGELRVVISNRPQAFALERAQQAGIEHLVIDHTTFSDREAFDAHLSKALHAYQIDLIVLAGFMRILSDGFLVEWQGKIVNIHPSLLPEYRGLHTHRRVIEDGKRYHGCSVHWVIPELDAGPLIAQTRIRVEPEDTPESLQNRVQASEYKLYPLAIAWILKNVELPYNTTVNDRKHTVLDCLEQDTLYKTWEEWQTTGHLPDNAHNRIPENQP